MTNTGTPARYSIFVPASDKAAQGRGLRASFPLPETEAVWSPWGVRFEGPARFEASIRAALAPAL